MNGFDSQGLALVAQVAHQHEVGTDEAVMVDNVNCQFNYSTLTAI
jgi:hypothetical protein